MHKKEIYPDFLYTYKLFFANIFRLPEVNKLPKLTTCHFTDVYVSVA